MRSLIRTILFDVGGTLIHIDTDLVAELLGVAGRGALFKQREPELRRAVNDYLTHPERHTEAATTFEFIMMTWCALTRTPYTTELCERVRSENTRYSIWRSRNRDADGVLEDLMSRGIRLGVVSNSDGRVAELLRDCGYDGKFEIVIDSGKVGVAKPDPAIFRLALDAMSESESHTAYVGDIPAIDMISAARAGLLPVLYDPCDLYGDEVARIERLVDRRIERIGHFSELPGVIQCQA